MGKFSNSLILDRQRLYFLYGGGKVQLYKQTHDNGIILYHAAIRENEKRVSVIMADDNEEKPLYDFSLSSGSIFTAFPCSGVTESSNTAFRTGRGSIQFWITTALAKRPRLRSL